MKKSLIVAIACSCLWFVLWPEGVLVGLCLIWVTHGLWLFLTAWLKKDLSAAIACSCIWYLLDFGHSIDHHNPSEEDIRMGALWHENFSSLDCPLYREGMYWIWGIFVLVRGIAWLNYSKKKLNYSKKKKKMDLINAKAELHQFKIELMGMKKPK